MKKGLAISLVLLVFIMGCAQKETDVSDGGEVPEKTLSELQVDACNTADSAGTCDSRLPEVGIVLEEECCEVLGKCC